MRRGGTVLWQALPTLRAAGFTLAALALLGLLASLVVTEVRSARIEIAPLAVPEALVGQGLTPEVVARRLLDQIADIQGKARTTMARGEASLASEAIDFALPGVGLSLRAAVQTLRRLLGVSSPRVTGEIILVGGVYSLRLRLSDGSRLVDVGDDAPEAVDALLHHGAKAVLLRVAPFILASYDFDHNSSPEEVLEHAQQIARQTHPGSEVHLRAINLQGMIYREKLGDVPRAEQRFRRAIELQPHAWMSYANLASLLHEQRRWADAEALYRDASRRGSLPPPALAHYAYSVMRLGRLDEAEALLRRGLRRGTPDAGLLNTLAGLLKERGRHAEAAARLREALELEPDSPGLHSNLGEALVGLEQWEAAERSFAEALALRGGFGPAHANRAEMLRRMGRQAGHHSDRTDVLGGMDLWEKAERSFREALRIDPRNAEAHANFALLLEDTGRAAEALAHARLAHDIAPTPARAGAVARLEARLRRSAESGG
ncbi:MAG: tetratricopeptide repeat protein [Acetobacteraceae bacterium]|nr:tetratricopeptide repeat protein [Acetobacteraceae bacterium]